MQHQKTVVGTISGTKKKKRVPHHREIYTPLQWREEKQKSTRRCILLVHNKYRDKIIDNTYVNAFIMIVRIKKEKYRTEYFTSLCSGCHKNKTRKI